MESSDNFVDFRGSSQFETEDEDETDKLETEADELRVDSELLNSFKAKIESDINTLRNLTYKALQRTAGRW